MTKADKLRRKIGALFLIISLLMLVCGLTFLQGKFSPRMYVLYWLACMIFTFLTMVVALLDLYVVRRRSREERVRLAKTVFREFTDMEDPKTGL